MRTLIFTTFFVSVLSSAYADESTDDGFSLMEEGAQMLLRGLMQEMEPAIDDLQTMMEDFGPAMQQFTRELGPVLGEILERVDDIKNYDAPEILPNGDIIIRRKPDAPVFEPNADGAIEL